MMDLPYLWSTFNLLVGIYVIYPCEFMMDFPLVDIQSLARDLHDLHFWVYDGFYLGRYSISCKGIYVIYPLWVYDGLTLGWYLVSFARDLHDQPWWAYDGFFGDFFATWQQEKKSSSTHTKDFCFKLLFLEKKKLTRIQGKKFGNHQFIYFIIFETNDQSWL